METIDKVVIGLVLFALTSVLAYLFKMRQLYAAAPKLFPHATLASKGSVCEIVVFNRGNLTEEDVAVDIDPELNAELIAASSSAVTFEGSTMKVVRLHKASEASAMLLVENGTLDSSNLLSVTSKAAKGRILKRATDLPPNYGRMFLLFVCFGLFWLTVFKLPAALSWSVDRYAEYKLSGAYTIGWSDLKWYAQADIKDSYSSAEFPIRLVKQTPDKATLTFEIYNKTALPMHITVDRFGKPRDTLASPEISFFSNVEVPPMSKGMLTARRPREVDGLPSLDLEFTIKWGSEFIHGMRFSPMAGEGTLDRF